MKEQTLTAKRPARLEPLSDRTEGTAAELARFFTHAPGLRCIAGLDGYFKRLASSWTRALGWTLNELQARPFIDFVHPDDREATLAELSRLAGGAATISFDNRYQCKDGQYRWLQWNARPFPDRQLIYAIAHDLTDQRQMEREILDIGDREKERLGRELHDGLCQNLAGIAALSATLSRKLAARSEPAAVEAAEITELLNETIGHARDLARGLDPVGLEQIGLAAALEAFATNVQDLFRVACRFQCDRPVLRLGPEVERHLYRIAQEAVNNAITHGRAKRIDISLSVRDGKGFLSIRDNGVGISKKALAAKGIGLHTMDYRSRAIGASLQVQRLARRGTEVTCALRLPPDPPKERRHARKKS
ncbi:MAG TPA: PAS domain-containing protein [Hyphomicrobiaceae bacterium]|nr:PAS domain-containing protein [Hyphomicrobiaceae bacterium]